MPLTLVILVKLFHDGGPYHIETSPLICRASFFMIGTSVMKELKRKKHELDYLKN